MSQATGDAEAESARGTKRSAAVSLVLIAGVGATAYGLSRLEAGRRTEDVLVYRSRDACLADRVRSAQDCTEAEAAARVAYAATAPRYETLEDCERHHGPSAGCVPGATVTAAAQGRFLPVMTAFMMGRNPEQALPVQPLYPHAPEEERHAHGGGGGYCTGSGGRIAFVGGGSRVQVPTEVARTTSTTPRLVARGGFGGAGRAVASAGGHAGSGHGSGG
ncbi:DUF1190 domain-containing protein [Methylobacterium terricola]|nr:DUF1190 domain-containing protein [Methylobacterium terricola]